MPSIDYSKLLGKLKEKGITQEKLAELIGVQAPTLSLKLNNKATFKHNEIGKICVILNIPAEEIGNYFFCPLSLENSK